VTVVLECFWIKSNF